MSRTVTVTVPDDLAEQIDAVRLYARAWSDEDVLLAAARTGLECLVAAVAHIVTKAADEASPPAPTEA